MSSIGRRFNRASSSIYPLLARTGGIRPPERIKSRLALTLIAILATDTELKNLPGIGSLNASEYQLQWMTLILLLFMTFSHLLKGFCINCHYQYSLAKGTTLSRENIRDIDQFMQNQTLLCILEQTLRLFQQPHCHRNFNV
ncbi:MAG: hypothetical protein GY761_20225 [Hyphomicrobiales bacterium]|nr:hypothetical protein [Hyphomicrobiales bacterium]